MGNVWDSIDLAFAKLKDSVSEQLKSDIRQSYIQLLEAEAQSRRQKRSAEIMHMVKLKIALTKFETSYDIFKQKHGQISDVENWIAPIKRDIALISLNKNMKLR